MRYKEIKKMTKYKNTEIEITKVPMKKTKTKHVIKSNAKRAFTSRAPGSRCISSIYDTNIKRSAQTKQDGRSTNSMSSDRGREWQN